MPDERLRGAELRVKALEFVTKYFGEVWDMNPPDDGIEQEEVIRFMAAFAKEREDSAMREAAGLVEMEEELDGEPPKHVLDALERNPVEFLRATVRATKANILKRIHERLALKGGTE